MRNAFGSAWLQPCRNDDPPARLKLFPPDRALYLLLTLCLLLTSPRTAHAHIGSKDVFEQVNAGPYRLFVTIRPPMVIPGVATVEIRSSGAEAQSLRVTPVPMVGEASKHPPTADAMQRSAADPAFFTGSLWLMSQGSWKVMIGVDGAQGTASTSVPVPAMPLQVMRMDRPLGVTLGVLALLLVIGVVGIVAAATRESRLAPGLAPDGKRRRTALFAGAATLAITVLAVWLGGKWWDVEAADYSSDIYHPLALQATLTGSTLDLHLGTFQSELKPRRSRLNTDLLPDHGHLMHLYVIREPQMDAVYHLHPDAVGSGELQTKLPDLPPGRYRLFADIVHKSGLPETLTSTLVIPTGFQGGPLDSEDAAAAPAPLSAGDLGRHRPAARRL